MSDDPTPGARHLLYYEKIRTILQQLLNQGAMIFTSAITVEEYEVDPFREGDLDSIRRFEIIDMKELDDLDKQKALNHFLAEMNKSEESIRTEGTISSAVLRKEMGADD